MFETAAIQIHDKLRWLLAVCGLSRAVVSFACISAALLFPSCRLAADALPAWRGAGDSLVDWTSLEARASSAAGLAWTSPVEHFEVSDEELDARIEIETALVLDDEMAARAGRELATLGFVPRGFDLRATLREVESSSVLGMYSTISDRLYVAPENVLPGERVTVEGLAVHELVHALQARHSKLGDATLGLVDQDDLVFALAAVLEGDALFAESVDAERFGRNTVPTSREAIDADWDMGAYRSAFPDIPGVLIDLWVLPYPLGLDLARRHATESNPGPVGAAERSRLLVDPPMSSEQLLQPEKWLDPAQRDLPIFVVPPSLESEGCTEYARNTLGAIGWMPFLTKNLEEATSAGSMKDRIVGAVQGWGGDRYVFVDCNGTEHVAMSYVGDTESDAAELAAVLEPALRTLARDSAHLATELDVREEGVRVQATLGFDAVTRERLWNATDFVRFDGLDAFLASHPEVLERAASLRARAATLDQQ